MPTHYAGTQQERRALDIFIKLLRAARAMSEWTGDAIAQSGLTDSQFGVLETLYHLGPLLASQLADKHLKSRNNLTVIIDNLEKRGFVRRERDLHDRRAIPIHLTEVGRETVARALPEFAEVVSRRVGVLTTDEQEVLGTLLRKLGRQD
jgi:MarR family 2-MHQ and catechol resistance regulon transcriptional repressor